MIFNPVLLWLRSRSAATRNDLNRVESQIMAVQKEIHDFAVGIAEILTDLNKSLDIIADTPTGVGLGNDDRMALAGLRDTLAGAAAKASALAKPTPTAAAQPTATP